MKTLSNQSRTPASKELFAVSVGHFFVDFYFSLIPPVIFLFAVAMGLNLSQQALIAFVITGCGSFAQPIIGHFADKSGKSLQVILSLVWIAFWMSISGIVNNYYVLLITVGLGALGSALFHPLGTAMTVMLAKKSKGRTLSVFMSIGGFAFSVSPMIAIPLVESYGPKVLVFFMIPGLLAAAFMYYAQVHKVEMEKKQVSQVQQHKKINFFSVKWVCVLVFIAANKTMVRTFLITFGAQIILTRQMDIKTAGIVLSVFLLTNSFGVILGGILNDRFGSKPLMMWYSLLSIVSMMMIAFNSGLLLIVGFFLMGLALSGSNTANVMMAHDYMPQSINVATGLIQGFAGGLGGFIMLLFGKIADIYGLSSSTAWLLVPLALVFTAAVLLPSGLPQEHNIAQPESKEQPD